MIIDNNSSDIELFDAWKAGNKNGFTILYNRYHRQVFGFILRMVQSRQIAEDILQDTFFSAYRNIAQFDRNRNFLSWIFGIAHKRTIDHFRHVKVENEHIDDTDKSYGSKFDAPGSAMDTDRMSPVIVDAVATLDPLQREVFLLRELGDLSFKEIAEMMHCPMNTALGRMRLALKNIRKELNQRGFHGLH